MGVGVRAVEMCYVMRLQAHGVAHLDSKSVTYSGWISMNVRLKLFRSRITNAKI